MALDAGVIIGLVFILAFFGAVVWLEARSRRERRRKTSDENLGAAKRAAAEEESGERPRKR